MVYPSPISTASVTLAAAQVEVALMVEVPATLFPLSLSLSLACLAWPGCLPASVCLSAPAWALTF